MNRTSPEWNARSRFERLLDTIRERIIFLEYPPGSRIGEEELAAEFGVSRTPIRRVLGRLEYEEFVEIRQGAGTYITTIDWGELLQAYSLRMSLAELIGDLDPETPPPGTIEALEQILADLRHVKATLTPEAHRQLNRRVHAEVSKCIGNRQLRKSIDRLYLMTQRHWYMWLPKLDWGEEVDDFERQIEDTIRCMRIEDYRGVGLVWRNTIAVMMKRLVQARQMAGEEGAAAG